MTTLAPYPAYKDSGVDWIGDVPGHWNVLPNRALFSEIIDKDHPEEELLSVTISRGVITQGDLLEDSSKKDSSNQDKSSYKRVMPSDLAYNKMRAWQGALGVSNHQGIISPAYIVMRPSQGQNPRYLHYLFRTPAFATEAERWSYGITSDQWSLRAEHFKLIYSLNPPLDEQRAIADFLDGMDARITRFLAARRRMIALLEEQKQAIINQAVTRGLDPDVPLKDSGVDWLGEIPAHWEIMSLQRITESKCDGPFGSGLTSAHYVDEGVRVVRLQNIGSAEFKGADAAYISEDHYATLGNHDVRSGDILIAGLGDSAHPCGRACVAPASIEPAMVKADCFRFRVAPEAVNSTFLAFQLSATAEHVSATLSSGATRQRVNLQRMSGRPVIFPRLEEQAAIVEHIDRETSRIDALIVRHRREIDLMQEYRTRLISDVVTGKLDVRGVELSAVEEVIGEEIEAAMEDEEIAS